MPISVNTKIQDPGVGAVVQAALGSGAQEGDNLAMEEALLIFKQHIIDEVKADSDKYNEEADRAVLAQRGYRQLTNKEKVWYQKFIEASKSRTPKQEFSNFLTSPEGIMPETIIEDVFKDLREEHPLLNKINFTHTKFLTKWVLNDHTRDTAFWGELNSDIEKEITSAFKIVDISQNKLSAFAEIPKDMLDIGPTFIDKYIREVLKEAISSGLEKAIIDGTGKNEPIGLNRNISKGVSVSDGVYPKKDTISVTSFSKEEYPKLVSKLIKTENERMRKIEKNPVTLICNPIDYYNKIMPATTVETFGGYNRNVFVIPTDVIKSNFIPEGEAILCLIEEYFMGMGGSKDGIIEYSDEYKFLEDMRYYKIKTFGDGKAYDNTSALLLDISELEPTYTTVNINTDTQTLAKQASRKTK